MEKFERTWARILMVCAALNGIFVLILGVMISTDVLVRWITGRPLIGVFEISRILFVPIIFMVLGLVQWTDRQVRVDVLILRVTGRGRIAVRTLDQVLALMLFTILLVTGAESWLEAVQRNFVDMGMLEIPQAIPIGFMVFGVFLLVVSLILLLIRSVRQFIDGTTPDEALLPYAPPLEEG